MQWAEIQCLELNAAKTKAIVFGSVSNLTHIAEKLVLPHFLVNLQYVEMVDQLKSLGVTLPADLTQNANVFTISSKVHGVRYKLRQRNRLLSRETKIMLVSVLVFPHIDYACLVYDSIPQYVPQCRNPLHSPITSRLPHNSIS